ncbi:MAG TPA: carbohydrate-binding protein [Puia sp.]|nr:carbohydrate-binding protein [Puia sp.]
MLSPRIALIIFLLSSLTIASSAQTSTQAAGQSGAKPGAQTAATPGARPGTKPWNGAPQLIPGRVQCEFYDIGGEGVAYHDLDSVNHGSGHLNPANGDYLNEFRISEGVDISYTKPGNIDNNPYNFVNPEMKQLYVGWTENGEWLNYTVTVKKSAVYRIGLMYTCNSDGRFSLSADGKDIAGQLQVPTTHRDTDTVAWRQWHHWNKVDSIAEIKLTTGQHIITLYSISGNMNYDYLEFTAIPPSAQTHAPGR